MRYITWGLTGLLAIIFLSFLHYTLPRQDVVRIVGVEVQRIDTSGSWFYAGSEGASADGTRDVKIIQGVNENSKPRVYRNEDTGWGWPPFFKFDAANVQAQAADMTSTSANPSWVVVKRYGWRSQFLSIYPNVVSLTAADGPDDKPLPIGNIIILTALAAAGFGVYRLVTGFWNRRVDPVIDNIADVFDGDDDEASKPTPTPTKKSWLSRITGR